MASKKNIIGLLFFCTALTIFFITSGLAQENNTVENNSPNIQSDSNPPDNLTYPESEINNSLADENNNSINTTSVNTTSINNTPINTTPVNTTLVNISSINNTSINNTSVNTAFINNTPVNTNNTLINTVSTNTASINMTPNNISFNGSGILNDPYQINNCIQLQNINQNLTAYYILMNNIDCTQTINWNNNSGFISIDGLNNINQHF